LLPGHTLLLPQKNRVQSRQETQEIWAGHLYQH
jgi:hypothetical protein